MIPRRVKLSYYAMFSPAMRLNAARHRAFPLFNNRKTRLVQLGPGKQNYLDGWINVDANFVTSKPDVWADIRYTLPFPDNHVDCIYSHHVIEHLPNLDFHFKEMYRCLKPGGLLRVGGPHGDNAMWAMKNKFHDWFGEWPVKRKSIGGRFENFIFCKGEHLTILTESFLAELANNAGFNGIQVLAPGETANPDIISEAVLSLEPNNYPDLPNTLMIETRKPLSD